MNVLNAEMISSKIVEISSVLCLPIFNYVISVAAALNLIRFQDVHIADPESKRDHGQI
jgi:hypothetical protein